MIGFKMGKLETLALHGGPQAVQQALPHFVWPRVDREIEDNLLDQARKTLSIQNKSGVFSEFEAEFSKYHSRMHGLLFNSGTTALLASFFSLGLKRGDNVVVPDYTFFATTSPLVFFPIDIRFADCDESGNVTAESIEKQIDDRTRAVVVTHLWGIPCEMLPILDLCKRRNISLIEDCSHAHGAKYYQKLCGTFGDISIWSLQGQKIISGGEGGILLTDNHDVYELALLFGHYGKRCLADIGADSKFAEYRTTGFGLKLRAHPLAIRIALTQFRRLEEYLSGRRENAKPFLSLVSGYDFLRGPSIHNRDPSWYNLAFTYDEEVAGLPVERFFSALHAEGAVEFDRPNSTRNVSSYDLFRRPPRQLGLVSMSTNIDEERPGARKYFSSVIKMPVWTFPDESHVSSAYLFALEKVCEHVKRGSFDFKC
jgi:perosamine synthetase